MDYEEDTTGSMKSEGVDHVDHSPLKILFITSSGQNRLRNSHYYEMLAVIGISSTSYGSLTA